MNQPLDLLLPRLGRLCGSIALDDGPDALQECAIQILRGLPRLREPVALWSWARRIATHEAMRQAQRREPLAQGVEPRVLDATTERLEVRAQLAYLHRFEAGIRSARVLAARGPGEDRVLDLRIETLVGLPLRMAVIVRPGYCWMEARQRVYVVGLAAVAEGERTRFAHVERPPVSGAKLFGPLIRLAMARDLRRIEALAQERRRR